MMSEYIEEEIIVHPIHGMQLSEGYIRKDNSKGFLGCLPGFMPAAGKTCKLVRPARCFPLVGVCDFPVSWYKFPMLGNGDRQ